jgi:hypothetical protein
MNTPPPAIAIDQRLVALLGLDKDELTNEEIAATIYDTRGCCLIASESIRAVVAAITAMELRLLHNVAARLDTGVTRQIAVGRAAYKRTGASS